jgi:prepilin-type N-terminal cleavage/methylation domain-containing protein
VPDARHQPDDLLNAGVPGGAPRAVGQQGFTLMEFLAAAALLGLLVGVAVLFLQGAQDRARTEACESDKRVLQTAVETYRSQTGYLPANQGILIPVVLAAPSTKWTYQPPVNLQQGEPTYSPTQECA